MVEASCDVKFHESPEWDIVLPGKIYGRLRDRYDAKPIVIPQADVSAGENSKGQRARIALESSDGIRRIEFREDALTVQVRTPYPGWESFEAEIRYALAQFVTAARPGMIGSIRLRYRNEIVFPEGHIVFQEHFTIGMTIPTGFPKVVSSFYNGFTLRFPDDEDSRLRVAFASLSPKRGAAARLDIEIIKTHIHEEATVGRLLRIIRKMKRRETQAFESLITEKTRELFK